MGLGFPLDIPYYFAAGQGNKFNLKPDVEIEFDLIPDFRGRYPRFEATQIEPLEAGSLRYDFTENFSKFIFYVSYRNSILHIHITYSFPNL